MYYSAYSFKTYIKKNYFELADINATVRLNKHFCKLHT